MDSTGKRFHAKILLFGEYSLLHGSMALTVPFRRFFAQWRFPNRSQENCTQTIAVNSNRQLNEFKGYLLTQPHSTHITEDISVDAFANDLDKGIYLYSNIPSGYGLGSSGALVAAVYQRYARKREAWHTAEDAVTEDIVRLKPLFASMESFFHGSSSGIDPLSIFLGRPLLTDKSNRLSTPDIRFRNASGGFFLISTHIPRKTSDSMRAFHAKIERQAFRDVFLNAYLKCNDECIKAVLSNDAGSSELLFRLSELQWQLFREMIPEMIQPAWTFGLTERSYALKLCGAGGGGYLLGFTDSYAVAAEQLKQHHTRLIPFPIR